MTLIDGRVCHSEPNFKHSIYFTSWDIWFVPFGETPERLLSGHGVSNCVLIHVRELLSELIIDEVLGSIDYIGLLDLVVVTNFYLG